MVVAVVIVAAVLPVVAGSKVFFGNVVASALVLFFMPFFVSSRRISVAAITSDFRCIISVFYMGHSVRPFRARHL